MESKSLQKYCLLLGLAILPAFGCGGSSAKSMVAAAADNNMKKLGALYLQFQIQNTDEAMIGPADETEFKEFIRNQRPEGLDFLGVDVGQLDDMFVGERDSKPLKIRWSVKGFLRGPSVPVFFEEEGFNGNYMVGFNGFIVKEVDKSEYERLWSGEADGEGA